MRTLGWVAILFGGIILRLMSKGQSLKEIPKSLEEIIIGAVTADVPMIEHALSITGTTNDAPTYATPGSAEGSNPSGTNGSQLLTEMHNLGGKATGYRFGATGPTYYDCSGLVWRAMKNTRIYTGIRFTTATFGPVAASRGFATRTIKPTTGDIVIWSRPIGGHMGVVDGAGTFYGAQSSKSGIKSEKISGIREGAPTYWRINSHTGSANAAEHS